MSTSDTRAKLFLRYIGNWDADTAYERYDSVLHAGSLWYCRETIGAQTGLTDMITPNTVDNTNWYLLVSSASLSAPDGSIVYRDSNGVAVLLRSRADSILSIQDGVPAFIDIGDLPSRELPFTGYTLPNTHRASGTPQNVFLANHRAFYMGFGAECYDVVNSEGLPATLPYTTFPSMLYPEHRAQDNIERIYTGYRCAFAISRDNPHRVYAIGLDAGRFGRGMDASYPPSRIVSGRFEQIPYFETNDILVSHVMTNAFETHNWSEEREALNLDATINHTAITYFIERSDGDNRGRVFVSGGESLTGGSHRTMLGGNTADGNVHQLTGFAERIIYGELFSNMAWFHGEDHVYIIGETTNNITDAPAYSTTLHQILDSADYSTEITHVDMNPTNGGSGVVTFADGRGVSINTSLSGDQSRASTYLTLLPDVTDPTTMMPRLYSKVVTNNMLGTMALFSDGSIYIIGRFADRAGATRTYASFTQVNLPDGVTITDIYATKVSTASFLLVTSDGDLLGFMGHEFLNTAYEALSMGWDTNAEYRFNARVGANTHGLFVNAGWAGTLRNFIVHSPLGNYLTIETQEGYLYNCNNVQSSPNTDSINSLASLLATGRAIGVNVQMQTIFAGNTQTAVSGYSGNLVRRQGSSTTTNTIASVGGNEFSASTGVGESAGHRLDNNGNYGTSSDVKKLFN